MTELTIRRSQGPLTSLSTGEASSRMVEAYRLHPNAIKQLARCGQGYFLSDTGLKPVAYGMLPSFRLDYSLRRKQQRRRRGCGSTTHSSEFSSVQSVGHFEGTAL